MNEFTSLLQQGNAWFFIPSAILLGALHGLEPGHSKTMMAAFIIAIKGTVRQAIMLGLAATVSHTAIVWLIAFGGMYVSNKFTAQSAEPWLQLISAAIILVTALWMFWRTWRGEKNWLEGMQQNARHTQEAPRIIDTGHGTVALSIFEQAPPPRWRLQTLSGRKWEAQDVHLVIYRDPGSHPQSFNFIDKGDYLESVLTLSEPHNFALCLTLTHRDHAHNYEMMFHKQGQHAQSHHRHGQGHGHTQHSPPPHGPHHAQTSHHPHAHDHAMLEGLDINSKTYQDAHERAHAQDIKRRFTGKNVTNGQILLFGLTGGLIPCPAAITVLLICIQLKALTLGATLVVCFSIGLALTLVAVGVGAAVSIRHVAKRWSGFNTLARRAPYFSSLLIGAVGLYMGIHGYLGLFH